MDSYPIPFFTQHYQAAASEQAEVEVKVERRSDSFDLSLDLSLNLPESWRSFSTACYGARLNMPIFKL